MKIEVEIERVDKGYQVLIKRNGVITYKAVGTELHIYKDNGTTAFFVGRGESDVRRLDIKKRCKVRADIDGLMWECCREAGHEGSHTFSKEP